MNDGDIVLNGKGWMPEREEWEDGKQGESRFRAKRNDTLLV